MNSWNMLVSHRYVEAAETLERELQSDPNDADAIGTYSIANLALNRLDRALDGFKRANELERIQSEGESEPYLKFIGATYWILGKRKDALDAFRHGVDGIISGSITFSDIAGGVSYGVLYWYAGVTCEDEKAKSDALNFLETLAKSPRAEYWPGPLASFVIGEKSEQDVLEAICGSRQIEAALSRAEHDLLKRRELTQALFYFAAMYRAQGNEERCVSVMARCAKLENPVLEVEWYLARGECET